VVSKVDFILKGLIDLKEIRYSSNMFALMNVGDVMIENLEGRNK
jgi:hypothetical protein